MHIVPQTYILSRNNDIYTRISKGQSIRSVARHYNLSNTTTKDIFISEAKKGKRFTRNGEVLI